MLQVLNSIWNRFQGYIAGGAIAIAVVFFFLWVLAAGKAERERAGRLDAEDQLEKTEEELVRYSAALEAAQVRSDARGRAQEELRDDESEIIAAPVTSDCVASPAINRALDILRQRGAGDQAERDNP